VSEPSCDVAVIGAGPYGLATTVQLRRAGVDARVFGDPMSFWRAMPKGMFLRSNWSATNMIERSGELSLEAYRAETGDRFSTPVPLDRFVAYGDWVQRRAVPDVDRRQVRRLSRRDGAFALELEDGERLEARRVVVACGIGRFAWRPRGFEDLAPELVSHTGEHADLARFRGRRVAVIGGGQSALESAALLHEAGADVEVFVRRPAIVYLRGGIVHRILGPLSHVAYAPTDVGPLWYSRLVAMPALFGLLPRRLQTPIARRCIRPACAKWTRPRLEGIPLHLGCAVLSAAASDGGVRLALGDGRSHDADHVLLGTGYRVDIARYRFLAPELLRSIRRVDGYPVLARGLESSVPGLHFAGATAAWSFGPIMRFVSGSWYSARAVAQVAAAAR
jgi:NADPH-dependent 2,4-dienoyl-CoA reductase/sulfur reductase-like enzyme